MVPGKETLTEKRARAAQVFGVLRASYPEVRCTLDHRTPFQLLIMTILAAQCTDARVNVVAKDLFRKYPGPEDFLKAPRKEVEDAIRSTGFFRNKAKNILGACALIVEEHGGKVPGTMEELLGLPGVGRKTANVVLGECFGGAGVVVDTHCGRLARRLGFTRETDPVKVERALMKVWAKEAWTLFSHLMVFHGRAVCMARGPRCSACPVAGLCPFPLSREGRRAAK